MKITFSVNNQILTRTDSGRVIANSSDYLEVEVDFSTDWEYCEKTIQFRNGDTVYTYLLVDNKITQDKHLVLTVGTWKVSIFGVYGNQRITTNTANVVVNASGYIGVTGPTQDVYEELVTIMNSLHTEAASEAVVRSAVEEFITDNFINLVLGYVYENVYDKDEVDAMIPTDTSDLTNGAGFITDTVDTLTNYYLTSETYSADEIDDIISTIISSVYRAAGSKACAELLPSLLIEQNVGCVYNMTDSGVTTEYFVEGAGITIHEGDNVAIVVTAPNVYQFDLLTGFVDLSNYYTKSETDTLLAGKVDKVIGKGLSTNDYSDTDKAVVSGVTDALYTKADKDALWQDATESGNPVTIKTQTAQAAKQTVITMLPIQSGSGTPSPDNVRPISGRTQAEIVVKDEDDVTQSTVTIPFGSTVYGGTLNVETGELTIDTFLKEFNGTESFTTQSSGANKFYRYFSNLDVPGTQTQKYGCSHFENAVVTTTSVDIGCYVYWSTTLQQSYINFRPNIESVTDLDTFKAWLTTQYNNGTPVQVFSKLRTPTTTTFTAAQVNLIKGLNNVSTDADSITLTYLNDAESLTDADNRITSVLGDLAKVEGATASQNYAAGDYLVFEDKFCKASGAITSGDSLAIGTNLTQTTVGAELLTIIAQLA